MRATKALISRSPRDNIYIYIIRDWYPEIWKTVVGGHVFCLLVLFFSRANKLGFTNGEKQLGNLFLAPTYNHIQCFFFLSLSVFGCVYLSIFLSLPSLYLFSFSFLSVHLCYSITTTLFPLALNIIYPQSKFFNISLKVPIFHFSQ